MSLKNFMSYEDATTVIGAVKDAIDSAVSSAYHHAGTKTVAQLTHDLLIAANEGNVYNITDSGTTTSDFIEGIGKTIDEGSNVGICKVGDVYKFDLLSGFVDTTNFVQKSQTAGLLKNDGTVNDEIEDDVDSLKSGLTNVQGDVKLNTQDLTTPSRTKNLLPMTLSGIKSANTTGTWSGNDYTVYGVTFSIQTDSDGNVTGIKVNGTNDGTTNSILTISALNSLANGTYAFNGCPSDGSTSTSYLQVTKTPSPSIVDIGTGNTFVVGGSYTVINCRIVVELNATISNWVFYPMIRPATITNPTFAPYIPSVDARLEAVESGLTNVQSDVKLNTQDLTTPSRTKNLLTTSLEDMKTYNAGGTWSGNAYTQSGVTFTVGVDSNGYVTGITVNGTASEAVYFNVADKLNIGKFDGSYVINGGVNGGALDKFSLQVYSSPNSKSINVYDNKDKPITYAGYTSDTIEKVYIVVRSGVSVENLVFSPMIRLTSVTNPTFAPYIPSVDARLEAVESGDYKVIASVTGDGVKTVAQLLPDLFSSVPSYTKRCSLIYGKAVLPMAEKTTNNAKFGNVSNYQGTTYLLTANIQPSTAYLTELSIASNGTITATDRSTEVPTNGAVISLVQ